MNKNFKSIISVILFVVLVALQSAPTFAVSVSDLQKQRQYQLDQAAKAKKAAEEKKKQADALKGQINYVEDQIDSTQQAITGTSSQISSTEKSITDLESQIREKESEIDRQKEKMSEVISSWYMEGESGLLEAVVSADNLSQVISKKQYYDSIRQQLQTTIEQVNQLKADLEADKSIKNSQLTELSEMKNNQVAQASYLQDRKLLKSRLLTDTTSAVSQLESEKKAAEKSAAELQAKIDEMSAQLSSAYSGGVRQQGGDIMPTYGSWYQAQLGNYTRLGSSPYQSVNIHNYGCYITSLAMVATYYGKPVTNTQIATTLGSFSSDGYLRGMPPIGITVGTSNHINKSLLDSELDGGHPVIAGVLLDSFRGKRHPNYDSDGHGFDHFIVITSRSGGKYYMHDPARGRGYRFSDIVAIRIVRPL